MLVVVLAKQYKCSTYICTYLSPVAVTERIKLLSQGTTVFGRYREAENGTSRTYKPEW